MPDKSRQLSAIPYQGGGKRAKPLAVQIVGTGRALPEKVLSNQDFERTVETSDEWIRERTGIVRRHIVSEGESTATLASQAGLAAINDAGLTPSDIDLIIVATITPECFFPSTACFVQEAIGAREIPAYDLSAACSGFIYALINGALMMQGGYYRHVLVIGAETMSRITDYEDRATCILFGDGAGAVVLSPSDGGDGPGILHHLIAARGTSAPTLWLPAGGSKLPPSMMTVQERLHYCKMQGREVYKVAVKQNMELIDTVLNEAGYTGKDLAVVIPHQSNLRIIDSARERLGLPREKMYTNIQECGNTSAASIPLGIDDCLKSGRVKPGDLVLLVAFGAGWTWGGALLRM